MQKGLTKDEMFLVKLADMAEAVTNIYSEHDRYVIGKAISQNDKSIDNIVRMLAQTNFIKKGEGSFVFLTQQGISYVRSLRGK